MRAHTIKIMSRRRRNARRRRALGLALGICALAIPASASADRTDGSINSIVPPNTEWGSQGEPNSPGGTENASGYSSPAAIMGPVPEQTTFVSGSPSSNDGFDWGDAALGAGAAMALVAFGGAALLTVRRRTAMSPSASAS